MECLAHSHLAGMRLPLGRGTPAQALEFARIARRRLQTISQREGINLSTSLPPPRPLEFWRTFIVAWISTATASSHRTGAQRSRALGSGLVFQPDGQLERFGLRRPRPLGFLCGSRGAHLRCHPATSSYSSRSSGCSLLAAFSLQKSRTINVTGSAAPAPRTPAGQSPPVIAMDALLELRVDVERHLGVGVADWLMTHLTSKLLASSAIEM